MITENSGFRGRPGEMEARTSSSSRVGRVLAETVMNSSARALSARLKDTARGAAAARVRLRGISAPAATAEVPKPLCIRPVPAMF